MDRGIGGYIRSTFLMPFFILISFPSYFDFCLFEITRWWFTIDRREADKLLMLPGNPRGTFLVRKSTGIYIYQWIWVCLLS